MRMKTDQQLQQQQQQQDQSNRNIVDIRSNNSDGEEIGNHHNQDYNYIEHEHSQKDNNNIYNDDDDDHHRNDGLVYQHNIDLVDASPQMKGYWKTRVNTGLVAIIFLEFIFFFSYIPYIYYYIHLLSESKSSSTTIACLFILLIYHFLYAIVHVSLYKTTFTDPGTIPYDFPRSVFSQTENALFETNSKGERRICSKCSNKTKPDRAHHCSKCKRCILKMDHHCPFVNNCVGYFNYKFFVLFLMWTSILCFFIMGSTVQNFSDLLDKGESPNVFVGIVFIIALIFGLGLTAFTCTHISYIIKNETTIEHMEKKSRFKRNNSNGSSPYDKGAYHNFCQVFGNSPTIWFLPINPTYYRSSGMIFPINCSDEISPLIGYDAS